MEIDAEAFEPILEIKDRKSKGPKLLFNTSIHSLPIKVVQDAGAALNGVPADKEQGDGRDWPSPF